jgi:hypothetical protein
MAGGFVKVVHDGVVGQFGPGNDHRDTEARRMHRENNLNFSVSSRCLGVSVVILRFDLSPELPKS